MNLPRRHSPGNHRTTHIFYPNRRSCAHRQQESGVGVRANSQPLLTQLCTLLDVPQPEPTRPDEEQNTYVFEKADEQELEGASNQNRLW